MGGDPMTVEDQVVKGAKCPFCGSKGDKLKSMHSSMLYCPQCSSGWFP